MSMLRQRCSLSMLHRSCEYVHGGVRLDGLGMLNILCMPFTLSPGVLRSTLSSAFIFPDVLFTLKSVGHPSRGI